MTHILHRKNIDISAEFFFKNYNKCIKKKLKTVAFGADLLKDENIDHAKKKAQNSDAERGRLYREIEVLKFQILF